MALKLNDPHGAGHRESGPAPFLLGLDQVIAFMPLRPLRAAGVVRLTAHINVCTFNPMEISFDPAKRARTLSERGLDFADAARVFAGPTVTIEDDRQDYGET